MPLIPRSVSLWRSLFRRARLDAELGGDAGAAIASRLLQSQLCAVHPRDPVSYGAAVALILGGAAVACWVPA